jgi:hypothetical protein
MAERPGAPQEHSVEQVILRVTRWVVSALASEFAVSSGAVGS